MLRVWWCRTPRQCFRKVVVGDSSNKLPQVHSWRYAAVAMNVVGFDDGPFPPTHRGSVLLVGAVCAGTRLDGIVSGVVQRDGTDSTRRMAELIQKSQFRGHVRAVLLQGIAVGGFNVVDIHGLAALLGVGVLVVTRREADMVAVRRALFSDDPVERPPVRGARRKWQLIQAAGQLELLGGQSPADAGLSL